MGSGVVMSEEYDVIIIGSGAGGGTLAHHLAKNSDKKILILERGDYLRREKDNWSSKAVFAEEKYHTHETWVDKEGKEFRPGTHYYVGGNTKVYGAALMRLREKDFGEVHHEGGVSPAWPINYDDLKPYYLQEKPSTTFMVSEVKIHWNQLMTIHFPILLFRTNHEFNNCLMTWKIWG